MKDKFDLLREILEGCYREAEKMIQADIALDPSRVHVQKAHDLAAIKHASRGAAITLLAYKLMVPDQDIRSHKDEYESGFSARTFDTKVTVPFLIEKSLPRNVESHWLTQTLSFAGVLNRDVILKTQPKNSGILLIEVVNLCEELDLHSTREMLISIFYELILIRNKDKVTLTRPKNLPIDTVQDIVNTHFEQKYKNNAPRLPQLAIYALYQALIGKIDRFAGQSLDTLQRMRSADRKAGTVGDIVVVDSNSNPVEAVEIKYQQRISDIHVCEAIEKVRGASVSRYYILSTAGISEDDLQVIYERKSSFLKQNGCEIIVNGIVETIGYYLRLLPNTTEFLSNYATLVEVDKDTGYEHRIAWNEICSQI